ncbi:hypothetical protein AMR72_09975 [Flavobacterium psychrophilum]|nr:hypothetical protein AMR72_09975 [Flavobacterium psychrophilum]AOE54374.1 hypothetical protein ALW18_09965 [Flavobacterium psychrophilum]
MAVVFFIVNFLVYQIPGMEYEIQGFQYPLALVYAFFLIFSLIILGILIKVSTISHTQVGFAFLLLTTIKMAGSYVFIRPILANTGQNPTEKVNFFVIFILFLAIEAYYTARLLNNKQ